MRALPFDGEWLMFFSPDKSYVHLRVIMDYDYNPYSELDTNDCGLVTYFFRRVHASFQD
jgi:hypothetical protein